MWELNALSKEGQVEEANLLGNNPQSFVIDSMGRITTSTVEESDTPYVAINGWNQGYNHLGTGSYRQDMSGTVNGENFHYDAYGQIDYTEIGNVTQYQYTIDTIGNLTQRGNHSNQYGVMDSNCSALLTANTLAAFGANTSTSAWKAGNTGYCYDQLGRQVINGNNQIQYYLDGQASRIKNTNTEVLFGYDANGQQVYEKQDSTDDSKDYTAWLFDGGRYELRDDNGVSNIRVYPTADVRVSFENSSSSPVYDLIMTDTMGSVLGLARKNGGKLDVEPSKTRGYTPYGAHRTPSDWSVSSTVNIGDAHGFTGQRYLNEFSLYQFGGRIYDTQQGRFTGPDPIVANTENWKNYNPYAYVHNDPMGWTDPSGYEEIYKLDPVTITASVPTFNYYALQSMSSYDAFQSYALSASLSTNLLALELGSNEGNPSIKEFNEAQQEKWDGVGFGLGYAYALTQGDVIEGLVNAKDAYSSQNYWSAFIAVAKIPLKQFKIVDEVVDVVQSKNSLFHYTSDAGLEGILNSKKLNPSLKANNPKDARYGDGQYLSDTAPGTRTNAELSSDFIGIPFQGKKFENFIEIDVTGLDVVKGRNGVFVIPNNSALDISKRVMNSGSN